MLTCYDASFAALLEAAGVDSLLIGDSLGNVLQGHESTLPVTLRDMVYHTAVRRARLEARLHHRRHAVRHLPGLARRRRSATPPSSWPPARRW